MSLNRQVRVRMLMGKGRMKGRNLVDEHVVNKQLKDV